jgi:hypothetical protein
MWCWWFRGEYETAAGSFTASSAWRGVRYTETSHQDQVFGNGGVHDPDQFPVQITVPGSQVAVWIPAQMTVVATDATPTTGGAYVTVAVSGRAAPATTALRVATAAARATFAAHPDGPS